MDKNVPLKYFEILSKIIDLVFHFVHVKASQKQLIREKVQKSYLTNIFQKMCLNLTADEREKLKTIVDKDQDNLLKFNKINDFVSHNTNSIDFYNVILDEYEAIVKDLIKMASENLKGVERDKFLNELNDIMKL